MKKWKNRLLPLLTVLVVLCAALLPQRLSALRDRTLLGTVHTEEVTDSGLLARPLRAAERIELLALWLEEPEQFTEVTQELSAKGTTEEMPALRTQVEDELKSLAEAGVLSAEMLPEDISRLSGTRTSVRLSEDLRGAAFLQLEVTDGKGTDVSVTLDADTGNAVALQVFFPLSGSLPAFADEIGRAFLDRLGVENLVQFHGAEHAELLLPETNVLYHVDWDVPDGEGGYGFLTIRPEVSFAPTNGAAAGYDDAG